VGKAILNRAKTRRGVIRTTLVAPLVLCILLPLRSGTAASIPAPSTRPLGAFSLIRCAASRARPASPAPEDETNVRLVEEHLRDGQVSAAVTAENKNGLTCTRQ